MGKYHKSKVSDQELVAIVKRCSDSLTKVLLHSGLEQDDLETQVGCLTAIYDTVKCTLDLLVQENKKTVDDDDDTGDWIH